MREQQHRDYVHPPSLLMAKEVIAEWLLIYNLNRRMHILSEANAHGDRMIEIGI